jgi:hypothetical protein
MARKLPWNTQRKAHQPSQGRQDNNETRKSMEDSSSLENDLDCDEMHAEVDQSKLSSPTYIALPFDTTCPELPGRNTSSSPPPAPPNVEYAYDPNVHNLLIKLDL